jgi:DNA-binding beta-propeller fold protein YncE
MRSVIARACVLALACDGSTPPIDAGPGTLAVTIEGPSYAVAGQEACFTARFEGTAESVVWTWGDGETSTEACHVWAFVGARVMGVEVRARGMRADSARSIPVVLRPADVAPAWSSTIVARGDRIYTVSPDHDTIAVLSAEPFALVREIPVCDRPRTIAATEDTVAVACQGDGSVALIDARSLEVRSTVAFGAGTEPYGVLADPRGGAFVISLRGTGEIVTIDDDGAPLDRIAVGPEPRGLAMNAEGTLLATRWRSTNEGAVVYTIDASDLRAMIARGATTLPPDRGMNSDTDNDGVLSFLNQIVPSPDGTRAVIPALKANVVTGMFVSGEPLTPIITARGVLGEVRFSAPDSAAEETYRQSFDDLDFASAAVFSPIGDRLFVAFLGAQVVTAVDAFDFVSVGSIDSIGEAPQGLALSPDGRFLYVQAYLSRTVRAYDVTDLSREPPLLGEVTTAALEPLSQEIMLGARVFHRSRDARMSRTGYLSCASCHLDGEGDGLVWDFTQRGEGLRNTIELRGHAANTPLHWTANFDEVQDFEHDIRDGQGGVGFLDDDVFHAGGRDLTLGTSKAGLSVELDALSAYVATFTEVGASPLAADPAVERGRAIFTSSSHECGSCHSGARFTDSAFAADGAPILHDVGTFGAGSGQRLGAALSGLDTPTLLGLWRSAPYLHDGSAPTLADVLARHGAVPMEDRADLAVFLSALDDVP